MVTMKGWFEVARISCYANIVSMGNQYFSFAFETNLFR